MPLTTPNPGTYDNENPCKTSDGGPSVGDPTLVLSGRWEGNLVAGRYICPSHSGGRSGSATGDVYSGATFQCARITTLLGSPPACLRGHYNGIRVLSVVQWIGGINDCDNDDHTLVCLGNHQFTEFDQSTQTFKRGVFDMECSIDAPPPILR